MGFCCGDYGGPTVQPVQAGPKPITNFEGPIKDRHCRDVIPLILFLGFLGGLGYVIFYAVEKGNPQILFYGTDSWGNVCNQKNKQIQGATYSGQDTTGLTKLFYFNINMIKDISGATSPTVTSGSVCATQCPGDISSVPELQKFATTTGSKLCRYDVPIPSYYDGNKAGTDSCPHVSISKTKSVFNRCVPEVLSQTLDKIGETLSAILDLFDDNFGQKCAEDFSNSWREIIYLSLISLGVSLVLVILMRFLAPILVWLVVIIVALAALAAIGFCWYCYYVKRTNFWLGLAIAVSIVGVIILLILLVLRKRIALVVQLFREAGKAIARMPQLLLQPFMTIIILGAVSAGLVYIFLYIVTTRNPHVDSSMYVSWELDDPMKGLVFIYLLGFIWLTQFIIGCERLTVSSSVAMWFFTRDKSKLSSPLTKSIWRLIRYHMGSVAFGSLIIALVVLARMILSFIEGRLKGSTGCIGTFFLKCLCCCLWCLEKILKFLTANAYIQIAINGYGFCKAARAAFMVIVRNALRVAAINSIGHFVLFLAKTATVAVVAVVGIELFRDKQDVHYTWLPITVACVAAYFMASCFFGLYELIIDAIFMCFVEDCDRNDGVRMPYFMSKGLMEFVKNSNEAKKHAERQEKQNKKQSKQLHVEDL